jgi:RimJ/RimL family protein N-acetyltransferase
MKIVLLPIWYDQKYLTQIACWRNKNKKILRTSGETNYNQQREWVNKITNDKTCQYYFIRNSENKELVGYCGLDKINLVNRVAELSLLIDPYWQKKRFGKTVVKELSRIAFAELNLNLIFVECYTTTLNCTFWEKCGFKIEAQLRERKYWNNNFYDSVIASITKKEYYDAKK